MKLLVFGLGPILGGVERQFYNNYDTLRSQGITCDFVTPNERMAYARYFQDHGSRVFHVSNFKRRPDRYLREVKDILRRGHYDGVYVNMLSAANTLPLQAARQCHVPLVIAHSHNDHVPSGLLRRILHSYNVGRISKVANAYFACSKAAGRWLFPKVDPRKVVLVPNAIPTDVFRYDQERHDRTRQAMGIRPDDFVVGHVGRFQEQKNHDYLIRLFAKFHGSHADTRLVLVGEGELRDQVRDQVRSLGLEGSVIFVDPPSHVEDYYAAMDCFVLPSLFEGLPLVGLEAQAAGLPVLASDTITREMNVTGDVRYLPLDDMDAWTAALAETMASWRSCGDVAARRIEQGDRFDRTEFSLNRSGSFLVDTLLRLGKETR